MYSLKEDIVEKLEQLPEPALREVLEFVEFKLQKAMIQEEPLLEVAGVLSGNSLSAEEIELEPYTEEKQP